MQCASFAALVEARRRRRLRMIPVSAVGHDFATLDEKGKVVKRDGGWIDPIYVDVPLCAVLPDALALAERSLPASEREQLVDDIRDGLRRHAPDIAREVLLGPLAARVRNALKAVVGEGLVNLLIEIVVRREARAVQPDEGGAGDAAQDCDQRLRGDVVEHMQRVVVRLEGRLPSSILSD